MRLSGEITPDRLLLVLAVGEEAQSLKTDLPVLLTGMGKVNAATALASGPHPARIVNLGTAGSLRPGVSGINRVRTVIQHDFSTDLLHELTGVTFGGPIAAGDSGSVTLAG